MHLNRTRRRRPAALAIRPTCVPLLLGRIARLEAKLDLLLGKQSEHDADTFEPSAEDLREMYATAEAYAADLDDDLPF